MSKGNVDLADLNICRSNKTADDVFAGVAMRSAFDLKASRRSRSTVDAAVDDGRPRPRDQSDIGLLMFRKTDGCRKRDHDGSANFSTNPISDRSNAVLVVWLAP